MSMDVYTVTEQLGLVEVRDGEGALLNVLDTHVEVIEVVTADMVGPPGPSGPPGVQGAQGVQGPVGPQGPFAPIFEQSFAAPLARWVIVHNLDAFPTVDLYDLDGYEISGDVQMPDRNTVVVMFEVPIAGTARLKA